MQALLALPTRPDAVFAANDIMAMGALAAIQAAGLQVPGDIAVMGFDDIPLARLLARRAGRAFRSLSIPRVWITRSIAARRW